MNGICNRLYFYFLFQLCMDKDLRNMTPDSQWFADSYFDSCFDHLELFAGVRRFLRTLENDGHACELKHREKFKKMQFAASHNLSGENAIFVIAHVFIATHHCSHISSSFFQLHFRTFRLGYCIGELKREKKRVLKGELVYSYAINCYWAVY